MTPVRVKTGREPAKAPKEIPPPKDRYKARLEKKGVKVSTLHGKREPAGPRKKRWAPGRTAHTAASANAPQQERLRHAYFMLGTARTLPALELKLKGTPDESIMEELIYLHDSFGWRETMEEWDSAYNQEVKKKSLAVRITNMELVEQVLMDEITDYHTARTMAREMAQAAGEPPPSIISSERGLLDIIKGLMQVAVLNTDGTPKASAGDGRKDGSQTAQELAGAAMGLLGAIAKAAGLNAPGPVQTALDTPIEVLTTAGSARSVRAEVLDGLHAKTMEGKKEE